VSSRGYQRVWSGDHSWGALTTWGRRTGTKQRLVSIFRQGLAVLLGLLITGHALPQPSWRPEAWLEIRNEMKTPPQQPPTPIPKNPSR